MFHMYDIIYGFSAEAIKLLQFFEHSTIPTHYNADLQKFENTACVSIIFNMFSNIILAFNPSDWCIFVKMNSSVD